jgi:hypothetical protein
MATSQATPKPLRPAAFGDAANWLEPKTSRQKSFAITAKISPRPSRPAPLQSPDFAEKCPKVPDLQSGAGACVDADLEFVRRQLQFCNVNGVRTVM